MLILYLCENASPLEGLSLRCDIVMTSRVDFWQSQPREYERMLEMLIKAFVAKSRNIDHTLTLELYSLTKTNITLSP
jgi:hypothetical protein